MESEPRMQNAKLDLLLDDAEFSKLYAERIAPALRALEADRKSALALYTGGHVNAVWAALALALFVIVALQSIAWGFVVGAIAFGALRVLATQPVAWVAQAAENELLSVVAKAIGCSYQAEGFDSDIYKRLLALNLLPLKELTHFQDRFTGRHNGCDFAFHKVRLETRRQRGESTSVPFIGYLIRIDVPKKFEGTTILRRDAGILNNWFESMRVSSRLQRVYLGSSELEKPFEVYTTDQVEARYLADLAFVARLLEIERRFSGRDLRCAFEKGDLLIAVESADREAEDAAPDNLFKRLMIYETYHKAGVSVTDETADEIDKALDEQNKPTKHTMGARLDTIARARAITGEVAEILRLIDNIVATV
jgi:hypothetical protein